jgi:hypothetical protein
MEEKNNNEILEVIKKGFSDLQESLKTKEPKEPEKKDDNICNLITSGFNDLKELLKPKEQDKKEEPIKVDVPIIEEPEPEPEPEKRTTIGDIIRRVLIG